MASDADQQWKPPTDKDVDRITNAAFTAFTAALDPSRPFITGDRNVRSIVSTWCPHVQNTSHDVPASDFKRAYLPAHFFDRYLYTEEKDVEPLMLAAFRKFADNITLGHALNEQLDREGSCLWLDNVLAEASLIIQRALGPLDLERIYEKCKHGPNSTTSVAKKDAYLDVKAFDLTGTDGALRAFVDFLRWDPSFRDELMDAYFCGDIPVEWASVCRVRGNYLSFVPKKFDSLRTMAAEPTLNMFFQLGTGAVIALALLQWCNIDLASQPDVHRNLARLMSTYPEIGGATVDWSQASDRIWVILIKRLFPRDWFEWLCLIRCPTSTVLAHHGLSGAEFELPMIGTMGNGFTFPLQTLVFYALLCGLARVENVDELGISVFGDDCIVPTALMPALARLAEGLGWSMNGSKSFSEGLFRESCGADCYRGVDMRPFRIERPAGLTRNALKAWVYIAINGMTSSLGVEDPPLALIEWGLNVASEWELGRLHVVPPRFGDNSGIRVSNPYRFAGQLGFYHPCPIPVPKPIRTVDCRTYRVHCHRHNKRGRTMRYEPRTTSARPYPGVTFKALGSDSDLRCVATEYPFYRNALAGLPLIAVDTWARQPFDPSAVEGGAAWNGRVPLKNVSYRSTQYDVHEWTYWLN